MEEPGEDNSYRVEIILVRGGRIWLVDSALNPYEIGPYHLAAVGSGQDYAKGAAFAFKPTVKGHKQVVAVSVDAAIKFDRRCGGVVWLGTT